MLNSRGKLFPLSYSGRWVRLREVVLAHSFYVPSQCTLVFVLFCFFHFLKIALVTIKKKKNLMQEQRPQILQMIQELGQVGTGWPEDQWAWIWTPGRPLADVYFWWSCFIPGWGVWEATDGCFSPSLSPSLPLFLREIKSFFLKKGPWFLPTCFLQMDNKAYPWGPLHYERGNTLPF